jgi:hypothetical protein
MTRKAIAQNPSAAQQAETAAPEGSLAKTSKVDQVVALLRRPEGATIEAMIAATGWQAHTVRGAISGALKKKAGLTITSEKTDGVRIYRIAAAGAA